MIPWWKTSFGEDEVQHVTESIRNKNISQGEVTEKFEYRLAEYLQVSNVIAVSSGTSAITMALMSIGIKPDDEVIVPNRTWIATAHAVHIIGAKVVLVDVELNRPIIDAEKIEEKITSKTRAILPVHMNGRSANMKRIKEISKKYNLYVVEDAAQALGSRNSDGYLGTQSDVGCFSLSVAKVISTGQGGFVVTNDNELADKMRAIRTHGVENVKDPDSWVMPGFNFRFTDIQASIGLEQLKRLPERIKYLCNIYRRYERGLNSSPFSIIPVDLSIGEVPVYSEFLVEDRKKWMEKLKKEKIETRPFYPSINTAEYLGQGKEKFVNSRCFCDNGLYLPSGPSQEVASINRCIESINRSYFVK